MRLLSGMSSCKTDRRKTSLTFHRFANTVLNIITDIATTVLPLPVLRTLQLPKRQKMLLMVVFSLGFTTCVVSILRLHSLYIVSRTTDLSWDNPMPAIWSSTELNVAILCSCLPTLKGLISRIWPRLLSTGHTGQRSGAGPHPHHSLGHISSGHHGRQAQQQWEEELKYPGRVQAFYDVPSDPTSQQQQQRPTFLETDSDSSVPAANRIYVRKDFSSVEAATVEAGERDSSPTLTRGEDMRFMVRKPTYKV